MPLLVPTTTTTISGVILCPFHVLLLFRFGLKTPVRVASELSVKRTTLRFLLFVLQRKKVMTQTTQAQSNRLQKKVEKHCHVSQDHSRVGYVPLVT